jgi:activator of 2-hydroxyglutaryl-CoA dehydratase
VSGRLQVGATARSLGLCFGASTVSIVVLEEDGYGRPVVAASARHAHHGDPRRVVADFFARHPLAEFHHVAITGRRFVETLDLAAVTEPEAVETAVAHLGLAGKYDAVISLGGETFFAYFLDPEGRIARVETGGKCASGTGEFFLQQIGRMNLDLAEAVPLAENEEPHHVSGRCSVFCKSDCTHALNIGTSPGAVAAGLAKMMAEKIGELLAKGTARRIVVIGGVTLNRGVLRFLHERHPHLYVPAEAAWFEALGAALGARTRRLSPPRGGAAFKTLSSRFSRHPPLADYVDRVEWKNAPTAEARTGDVAILGLDVGSTTTKATLIRQEDAVTLASVYLRTNGRPVQPSRTGYRSRSGSSASASPARAG